MLAMRERVGRIHQHNWFKGLFRVVSIYADFVRGNRVPIKNSLNVKGLTDDERIF